MKMEINLDEDNNIHVNAQGEEEQIFLGMCYMVKAFCKNFDVEEEKVMDAMKETLESLVISG